MAKDNKSEFEAYVQKLTSAIFSELLLDRMEETFRTCEGLAGRLDQAAAQAEQIAGMMRSELTQTRATAERLDQAAAQMEQTDAQMQKKHAEIEEAIEQSAQMTAEAKQLIQADIQQLNHYTSGLFDELRKASEARERELDKAIKRQTEESAGRLANVLSDGEARIAEVVGDAISAEELDVFIERLEQYTVSHKKSAEAYLSAFQKTSAQEGERLRSRLDEMIRSVNDSANVNRSTVDYISGAFKQEAEQSINSLHSQWQKTEKQLVQTGVQLYGRALDERTMELRGIFKSFSDEEQAARSHALAEQNRLLEEYQKAVLTRLERFASYGQVLVETNRRLDTLESLVHTTDQRMERIDFKLAEIKASTEKRSLPARGGGPLIRLAFLFQRFSEWLASLAGRSGKLP